MIVERVDGTWSRVIVAGVKPRHFLLSHIIEGLAVMLIQCISTFTFVIFFLAEEVTRNGTLLILLITLLNGIAGVMFGQIVSVVTPTVGASLYVNLFFVFPAVFLSGEYLNKKV